MTLPRLAAGVLIGLAATAAAPGASAQTWLERLFGGGSGQSAPTQAAPPAATQPAAPAGAVETRAHPLPPRRPAALAGAAAPNEPAPATAAAPQPRTAEPLPLNAGRPVVTAAVTPEAALPAPTAPASDREAVERANAYFNGITSLVGNFVQVGGDGRRMGGALYLQRPGKLRFEYNAPSTLEVIADGRSVAVRDSKLATQDLYPIGQTPLKFLTRDQVNFGTDLKVTDVAREPNGVRIALEDRSTLGGTSKITLYFDPNVQTLTQWRIVDPQGFQTTVVLSNVQLGRRVDPRLFVINYERMLGESSR